jgi:hypothetical protein
MPGEDATKVSEANAAALAKAAGLSLPPERLAPAAAELSELLALGAGIDAAALEGVEPALAPQNWR